MKFHVHVYKVIGKLDLDIEASNDLEAREKALELAKTIDEFQESDCQFIVFSFDEQESTE